jgi:hypothetical protein
MELHPDSQYTGVISRCVVDYEEELVQVLRHELMLGIDSITFVIRLSP